MLKIHDRGPTRRNQFLLFDGETQVGIFGNKEDAENRLKELQGISKKPKFKTTKNTKEIE